MANLSALVWGKLKGGGSARGARFVLGLESPPPPIPGLPSGGVGDDVCIERETEHLKCKALPDLSYTYSGELTLLGLLKGQNGFTLKFVFAEKFTKNSTPHSVSLRGVRLRAG